MLNISEIYIFLVTINKFLTFYEGLVFDRKWSISYYFSLSILYFLENFTTHKHKNKNDFGIPKIGNSLDKMSN